MKTLSRFERKVLSEITVSHPVTFQEVETIYNQCLSFDMTIYQIENKANPIRKRRKKIRTNLEILAEVAPYMDRLGLKEVLNSMKLLRSEFQRIIENRILEVQCDNVMSPVKKSVILSELKKMKLKL